MHLVVCTNNAMQLDRAIYNYKSTPFPMVVLDIIRPTHKLTI